MGAMKQNILKTEAGSRCIPASSSPDNPWCFSGVLEGLDNAVIIMDETRRTILFCNRAAKEILGTLQIEADYQPLTRFLESRNITVPASSADRESRVVVHNDRMIEFSFNCLEDEQISYLQISDVTEKKRLESIAQTVNTMDNLGFIFSGIRHEIGNPLNSIKMTNSVLQRNLERFSRDDISRYIDRTASEITRMEYLLQSLKNFSMFEKVAGSAHHLAEFLETFLNLIEPDLDRKSIRVECRIPDNELQVDIDPRALHQAMLNIITNAADAVAGKPDALLTITTRANGRLAWISITDNGCGMNEEQLGALFQPFHTNKPHGNGLGLVITQKLLTMMQATIDIDSTPGRGTTVQIGLPLAKPTGDNRPPEPQPGEEPQ